MTAEWKKTALERTKRKNDLAQAQAELKLLKDRLAEARHSANYYRDLFGRARDELHEMDKDRRRYDALRVKGVLVEIDGEFKYLQGKDLDEFWDERAKKHANRILNEAIMAQMMANTISTPPGGQWIMSAEL